MAFIHRLRELGLSNYEVVTVPEMEASFYIGEIGICVQRHNMTMEDLSTLDEQEE